MPPEIQLSTICETMSCGRTVTAFDFSPHAIIPISKILTLLLNEIVENKHLSAYLLRVFRGNGGTRGFRDEGQISEERTHFPNDCSRSAPRGRKRIKYHPGLVQGHLHYPRSQLLCHYKTMLLFFSYVINQGPCSKTII